MLRLAFVLLPLLLPTVLPCVHVGSRAGQLNNRLLHVHVVVFGKVNCPARAMFGVPPTVVTLELGHREVDPSDYQELNHTSVHGQAGPVDFAFSGDYSYDLGTLCKMGEPRITVKSFCGQALVDGLKPAYKSELGGKNGLLEVYDLGKIRPTDAVPQ